MEEKVFKRKNSLAVSYYVNFFCLIVIPILLIIFVVFGIIQTMMLQTAIGKIKLVQENVVSTLNNEVRDTSIRLSHFIHSNNYQVIEMAEAIHKGNEKERYDYTQRLTESFQYMVAPADDIISVCFYLKNGEHIYLKDDIRIPKSELKSNNWYQSALLNKGQVQVGSYAGNTTYSQSHKRQYNIVAALSPTDIMDKKQQIEMIVLVVSSDAANMIGDYNTQKNLGTMYLADSNGDMLLNISDKPFTLPPLSSFDQEGTFKTKSDGKKVMFQLADIRQTGWKVISMVEHSELIRGFQRIAFWIICVTLALFVLFAYFSFTFLKNILIPVNNMARGFRELEDGNLNAYLEPSGQAEIRSMTYGFNAMVSKLKILIELNKKEERQKHEAEIRALQSQINPHFLVNTLNSIKFMAQVAKFDGIKNMAEALITILSCSFRSNISFYSVKEEIDTLKSYSFLMGIRYSNSFEITYEIAENCLTYQIPRLILQPLVENSIVHGFSKMEDIGEIQVKVTELEEFVFFEILDNGKGMSREAIAQVLQAKESSNERISIGISNVNDRLKLNYGQEFSLQIESEIGHYTKITFSIPKQEKQEEAYHV